MHSLTFNFSSYVQIFSRSWLLVHFLAMETVASLYAGSGGSYVPLENRSFVPDVETLRLPLKYLLRLNNVSFHFFLNSKRCIST